MVNLENEIWFKKLGTNEQQDVSQVVQTLHDWMHGKLARPDKYGNPEMDVKYLLEYALNHFYFFSLYAIGSAITDKPNPADTDLLLVTNFFPNETGVTQPVFKDLISRLGETHKTIVDSEIIRRYSDAGTDARLKIDLQREDINVKPIDIVYQWDILSPAHWEAHDKQPLVKIFNLGANDPVGYDGALEWHRLRPSRIPLDRFRLSDYK